MEYIQQSHQLNCSEHSGYDIIYIQVNEIQENKNIFYCEVCVTCDLDFKPRNYIRVKQIQECAADNQIINFWPPVDNMELQRQFFELTNNPKKYDQQTIITQITKYFDDLKEQILVKLDECQKKAIMQSESMANKKDIISKKYSEISQVDRVKNIILNNSTTLKEKENLWKLFVSEVQSNKAEYTKTFQEMFKEQQMKSADTMNKIKDDILKEFEKINFFTIQGTKTDMIKELEFIEQVNVTTLNKITIVKNAENSEITFTNSLNVPLVYGCKAYFSNLLLENDKKYVMTFKMKAQVESIEAYLECGFMKGKDHDDFKEIVSEYGCMFQLYNNELDFDPEKNTEISKFIKGDFKNLKSDNTEFQLILHAKEGLIEISDFPNQNHIVTVEDTLVKELKATEKLRFYISILDEMKVTLTSFYSL